ncbi:hypothetical protein CsSME_00004625 [Camellia sinensis var. sinensis]
MMHYIQFCQGLGILLFSLFSFFFEVVRVAIWHYGNKIKSVSPCMERAVLDQLADYFKRRLAGYPTTLSEDDSLLADFNLDPKKRVATQLVRLEKKMLSACLQATVVLINQLPDTTVSPCPAPYAPKLR